MARDWPRLVLAAATVIAVAASAVAVDPVAAQTTKASKKTAKKPATEEENAEQGQPKKKKQDPAEAQKVIEAAQKLIEAGKADAAVQSLTATLTAGNLPPGLMARALLYRGTAYRQLQKPALAIADLTQALWLKGGLAEADRAEALRQRTAAYSDAGLSDTTVASAPDPARTVSSMNAVTTGSNAPAEPSSSGSGWNIFGGLFGSSNPPPQSPPAPKVVAAPPAQPSSSSWSSTTEVRPTTVAMAPQAPVATPPPAPPPPAAVAPRPEGKFRLQLGLVRTESEAGAIAARVSGELATIFEARSASVDQAVVGNMGTMYRVRVGPYASANEGQAACARLKGTGLDCLVTSQ